MRTYKEYIFFPLLFISSTSIADNATNKKIIMQYTIEPYVEKKLSNNELKKKKNEALNGSVESARLMAKHFSKKKELHTKYKYWLGIAAENGGLTNYYHFGYHLIHYGEIPNDKQRGCYWLNKALNGYNSILNKEANHTKSEIKSAKRIKSYLHEIIDDANCSQFKK